MKGRVLLVEDETVLRLTFAEFLQDDGHDVQIAEDYEKAVAQLVEPFPEVIVTDIILPGKTGIELLKTVKRLELKSPVIIITGQPNVETAADALRVGAFDYLAKPVTGADLKKVVRLALEHLRLQNERDLFAARMNQYGRELDAIFNSVNEGIVTVDADVRIGRVNARASEMLQHKPEAAEGKAAAEVLSSKMQPAFDAVIRTLTTHEPVPEFRIELANTRGNSRIIVASTSPLIEQSGAKTGALLLLRDVTRLTQLEKAFGERGAFRNMIGNTPRMLEVAELIQTVADTDSTVLITGESGTGKELVAAALHELSARARKPFIKVNCAALSEDILESELFGHVKGAFTGAIRDRVGRFEAAQEGTILLDEIGDISPRLQQRLLRVLQEREFERVGDSLPIKVDVRIVASTNRDLARLMAKGRFREDLYYRLNVMRIELPPLRERREDIPLLVDHLVRRFNCRFNKEILGVAPETLEIFNAYPWWGNIRELENALEWAFIVCRDAEILPKHLPPELLKSPARPALDDEEDSEDEDEFAGRLSKSEIDDALARTGGNVSKASRILGVSRNTLYEKMRKLRINRNR